MRSEISPLLACILCISFALVGLGCATPGETFRLEQPPPQGQAQIYVYRTTDSLHQYDWGEIISLDDERVATLRAPGLPWDDPGCQYLLLSVAPGEHRLHFLGNTRGTTFQENPMDETFTAEPGRVYFVRVRALRPQRTGSQARPRRSG